MVRVTDNTTQAESPPLSVTAPQLLLGPLPPRVFSGELHFFSCMHVRGSARPVNLRKGEKMYSRRADRRGKETCTRSHEEHAGNKKMKDMLKKDAREKKSQHIRKKDSRKHEKERKVRARTRGSSSPKTHTHVHTLLPIHTKKTLLVWVLQPPQS